MVAGWHHVVVLWRGGIMVRWHHGSSQSHQHWEVVVAPRRCHGGEMGTQSGHQPDVPWGAHHRTPILCRTGHPPWGQGVGKHHARAQRCQRAGTPAVPRSSATQGAVTFSLLQVLGIHQHHSVCKGRAQRQGTRRQGREGDRAGLGGTRWQDWGGHAGRVRGTCQLGQGDTLGWLRGCGSRVGGHASGVGGGRAGKVGGDTLAGLGKDMPAGLGGDV